MDYNDITKTYYYKLTEKLIELKHKGLISQFSHTYGSSIYGNNQDFKVTFAGIHNSRTTLQNLNFGINADNRSFYYTKDAQTINVPFGDISNTEDIEKVIDLMLIDVVHKSIGNIIEDYISDLSLMEKSIENLFIFAKTYNEHNFSTDKLNERLYDLKIAIDNYFNSIQYNSTEQASKKKEDFYKIIKKLNRFKKANLSHRVLKESRVEQNFLKQVLINKDVRCKICGLSYKEHLVLSHIKPRSKLTDNKKLDFNNLFLLCYPHNSVFDRGYITFNDDGKIIISKDLTPELMDLYSINSNIKIKLTKENLPYIKYHREYEFEKFL